MNAVPRDENLESVLVRSQALVDALGAGLAGAVPAGAERDRLQAAADRLTHSVVRPLASVNSSPTPQTDAATHERVDLSTTPFTVTASKDFVG